MSQKNLKKQRNKFLRFTGLGIQMGLTIYLGNWMGVWLDVRYSNGSGIYTKVLTLVAVFVSIYLVITTVKRISEN